MRRRVTPFRHGEPPAGGEAIFLDRRRLGLVKLSALSALVVGEA